MHVISRKKLKQAATAHGDLESALETWYRITKKADWKDIEEVRKVFPSADPVDRWTVFNIKGNSYRLVADINYRSGRIFVRHVLTHVEYDRGSWKRQRRGA